MSFLVVAQLASVREGGRWGMSCSFVSATTGSPRVARRAGRYQATSATLVKITGTSAGVTGAVVVTRNNELASRPVNP